MAKMTPKDIARYSKMTDRELEGIARAYWHHAGGTEEGFFKLKQRISSQPVAQLREYFVRIIADTHQVDTHQKDAIL